jgi:UDP-N-acetylmuramate--alanine ligase
VAVFQPHLYTRTRDFAPAFGRALAAADVAVVTDVYAAREVPIDGISGKLIADFTASHGARVEYFPDRSSLAVDVGRLLNPGDVCLTLGAGDLDRMAGEMLETTGARG